MAALADALAQLAPDEITPYLKEIHSRDPRVLNSVLRELYDWEGSFAREEQREPDGNWRVWLINAGRGFGKTRSGAEWLRKNVESGRYRRPALVGRTAADVRDVMIEGDSGILAVSPPWARPTYFPSKRLLVWPNGAEGHTYGAEKPDVLRGPQHDAAWADELASWQYKAAWDNLMFGLRVGQDPRACVTTTPKPTLLLKQLIVRASTVVTGGSTYDNIANLAPGFIDEIIQQYEGTALGEQELYAKLLEEAEGALWKRGWIEASRLHVRASDGSIAHPDLDVLAVAIDPATTSKETSNETGIITAGRAWIDGIAHFYVLEDGSDRITPNEWGTRALDTLAAYDGDVIVAETNNGGDLVETVLRNIDPDFPYRPVNASRGKTPRAQPIAGLYQQGRVHHCGVFRDLEDQLCQWEPGTGADSPDRLDALVWCITHLNPRRAPPPKAMKLGGLDHKSSWLED